MPIKPENKHRYPQDWNLIRERIAARAGGKCEGCGVRNHALGGRTTDGTFMPAVPLGEGLYGLEWPRRGEHAWCRLGDHADKLTIIRIVCTVAHLDHTPENCADDNLRYLCQRCHLRLDFTLHAQHAYETRRAGKAIDMFEVHA